jgi:hypothetical protein
MAWNNTAQWQDRWGKQWHSADAHTERSYWDWNRQHWDNEVNDDKAWDDKEWNSKSWSYEGYYHSGKGDWNSDYYHEKHRHGSSGKASEEDDEDLSCNATFLGSTSIANGHKKGVLKLEKQGQPC